jgi:hypothetical protein
MQSQNLLAPQNTPPLQPGDLVDEREAASILKTEVRTLRNWRALGKGPRFLKVGKRLVRYHRADLSAFVVCTQSEARFESQGGV